MHMTKDDAVSCRAALIINENRKYLTFGATEPATFSRTKYGKPIPAISFCQCIKSSYDDVAPRGVP